MMALSAGTRIGSYEVIALLGAGGMGEVYRARDTKLKREVAIKVLPDAFANDAERLARFQREAELLATLNHPNIGAVYGFEQSPGAHAIILELIEGDTLEAVLKRGPLAVERALEIARQIADALEAAHARGIIHRDLKPANVKITPDSRVKVLDFGLAKAMGAADTEHYLEGLSASPTITSPAMRTTAGVILGTAAYMSPEQARGKAVDKRTDIWAFGCVLYEMISRKRAFDGEDVTDVLAKVLEREPDFQRVDRTAPPVIRKLLRRCLAKDQRRRLADIADARLELDEPADPSTGTSAAQPTRGYVWHVLIATAAAILGAAAGVQFARVEPTPSNNSRAVTRFHVSLSDQLSGAPDSLGISPGGRELVYVVTGSSSSIMVRRLDQMDATPLATTEGANSIVFSPDGASIGFIQNGVFRTMSLRGGSAATVCADCLEAGKDVFSGATWGAGGIVFGTSNRGLLRIPEGGGTKQSITVPRNGESHFWPRFVPGTDILVFTIWPGSAEKAQLAALNASTGITKPLTTGTHGWVVGSQLVFSRAGGGLWIARFDSREMTLTSEPVRVLDGIYVNSWGYSPFALSDAGTLVYASDTGMTGRRRLVWVDRRGTETDITAEPRPYYIPRLSPDGNRVALDVTDRENRDIWIHDLRTSITTRLTRHPALDSYPAWSRDGSRVLFASAREGPRNLYSIPIDGTSVEERLTQGTGAHLPYATTMVGDVLLSDASVFSATTRVVTRLPIEPGEVLPSLSPDNRWMAYQAGEPPVIYVRPYPETGRTRLTISTEGARWPLWSPAGGEVFYLQGDAMTSVRLSTTPTLRAEKPEMLFRSAHFTAAGRSYDVDRNGNRFLMIKVDAAAKNASEGLVVIENWLTEAELRLPGHP